MMISPEYIMTLQHFAACSFPKIFNMVTQKMIFLKYHKNLKKMNLENLSLVTKITNKYNSKKLNKY